mmetsp:Transcript_38758/g.62470  ORF Transcript_38758/g.62470 Transcript_38758/m.62470 type:complete len:385 (-) Transcript_38758:112-1266(-)
MHRQIVGRTIGDTHCLHPPRRHLNLGIPAIAGVVRHLCGQVLPESHVLLLDACLQEEEGCATDKVGKRFVGNCALFDGITQRFLDHLLPGKLDRRRQHVELKFIHASRFELFKVLVLGAAEKLNLGLRELPLTHKATTGGNLVAVGLANLRHTEGHLVGILLGAEFVIQEDSLRCLRAQVALEQPRRTNGRREHEVELVRLGQVVASFGCFDAILFELGTKLFAGEAVGSEKVLVVLRLLVGSDGRHLEPVLHLLLQELVRAEELVFLLAVFDHEIVEAVDVTRRLEHVVRHDGGIFNLHEVLLDNEVLAPERSDVGLERRPRRAVSVEARRAAINIKGRAVEETSFRDVLELAAALRKWIRFDRLRQLGQVCLALVQLGDSGN